MSIQQDPSKVLARAGTKRGFMARMSRILDALLGSGNPQDHQMARNLGAMKWRGGAAVPGAFGGKRKHNGIKWRKNEGIFR